MMRKGGITSRSCAPTVSASVSAKVVARQGLVDHCRKMRELFSCFYPGLPKVALYAKFTAAPTLGRIIPHTALHRG